MMQDEREAIRPDTVPAQDWDSLGARIAATGTDHPPAVLARALALQRRLGMDDATFAAELADRLSYRAACGLAPADPVPDAGTLRWLRHCVDQDHLVDSYATVVPPASAPGPCHGAVLGDPPAPVLREALERMNEMCVIADAEGRIRYANAAATAAAATTLDTLAGQPLDALIADAPDAPWRQATGRAVVWRGRARIVARDGERVVSDVTAFPLEEVHGGGFVVRGHPASTGDEPNAVLNRVITNAPLPMALAGRHDGRIRVSSHRMRDLLRAGRGGGSDPLAGRDARDFYIDPDVRRDMMARLQNEGEARDLETEIRRLDGTTFNALLSFAAVTFDGDDDVLVTVQDVTHYRKTEADLRYRTAFHEALSELSPDGILVMNTNNNPVFHNKRFHEIFNLHPELIEAEDGEELLRYAQTQVQDPAGFLARVRYLAQHPYERGHDELSFLDGRVVERHAGPMLDRSGNLLGRIWFFRDITARKHLEDELREARDRAAAGEAAKTRFLSTMNHELRTPLNAIIGFADVIRNRTFGEDVDAYVQYAQTIHESGQHLLELVSDVLDMSKLEHGAYRLSADWVDLRDVARRCVRMLEPQATSRQVTLDNSIRTDAPLVYADERALRQMLLNLLSNGVKFAGANGVVRLRWGWTPAGELAISVADTGHGIAQADIDRIVKPFEQAANTLTSSDRKGSGLGLAITRSLMALHGGRLELDSRPGEGTEARLIFPAERVRANDAGLA